MNGKHHVTTIVIPLLAAAVLITPGVPGTGRPARAASAGPSKVLKALETGALATFDVHGERFRVWTTKPQTIKQLKALQAGTSTAHIPNGRVLPGPGKAGFNKPWNWHLDSQDIQLAEVTTEVCDARPSYVNEHLDEFVNTVKRYCPWGAQLVSLHLASGAPAAPTSLRLIGVQPGTTSAQRTRVSLRWQDRSGDETGFRIHATFTRLYGGTDSQSWDVGRNATRTTVAFVAGGINPVSKACFIVSAINAAGESARSNKVCITL